ncbi:MAG: helix-turn-helix domain-containing protein [Acidobacteriia bacterium]|nr:helix-turn-helix domain-containing protein [Terriglobia bacterium]
MRRSSHWSGITGELPPKKQLASELFGALKFYYGQSMNHRTEVENVTEQVFSVGRIAKRLKVSPRTARRLVETGELKAYRIRKQWRIFEPDFQDYLARQANSVR